MKTIDLGPADEPGRPNADGRAGIGKKVSALREGTHEHDVYITSKILHRARQTGMVQIQDTADGDIFLYYNPDTRAYDVSQIVDGKTVTFVRDSRRFVQEYLINLRERSRAPKKRIRT
jgi:hypothetical protein